MALEATRIGLKWPKPQKAPKRGAPSRQERWEEALYNHLDVHGTLPMDVTLERPSWWTRGPIVMSDEMAFFAAVQEPPSNAPTEPCGKRHKKHVGVDGRAFFFRCYDYMSSTKGRHDEITIVI